MKHTPGPWEIESPTMAGSHRIVIGAYGFGSVAAASLNGAPLVQSKLSPDSPYYGQQIPTMEANARLIAAAPDLLEACKDIATILDYGAVGGKPSEPILFETYHKLKRAIAKATGAD